MSLPIYNLAETIQLQDLEHIPEQTLYVFTPQNIRMTSMSTLEARWFPTMETEPRD